MLPRNVESTIGEDGNLLKISRLLDVVEHCLNVGMSTRIYLFDNGVWSVLNAADQSADGLEDAGLVIEAENAAVALCTLLHRLSQMAISCISSSVSEQTKTMPLGELENFFDKISFETWEVFFEHIQEMDLMAFGEIISEEIRDAKHLLTFGTSPPPGTTIISNAEKTGKGPGRDPLPLSPKERKIKQVHKKWQSHEVTACLANAYTRDGLPDVKLVELILKRKG